MAGRIEFMIYILLNLKFNVVKLYLYSIGLFSLVFATMAVMYNDAKEVLENGFFQGYDSIVVLIVLIQVYLSYNNYSIEIFKIYFH